MTWCPRSPAAWPGGWRSPAGCCIPRPCCSWTSRPWAWTRRQRALVWEDVLRLRQKEQVTIFLTTHYMD